MDWKPRYFGVTPNSLRCFTLPLPSVTGATGGGVGAGLGHGSCPVHVSCGRNTSKQNSQFCSQKMMDGVGFQNVYPPFYFDFDPWRAKPPENWNIREEQARVKPNQSPSFAPGVLGNHRYRTSSTLRHFCRSQGSCPKPCPNNRRTIRPCKHVPGLEVAARTHAL
jgi:hypothetical protein